MPAYSESATAYFQFSPNTLAAGPNFRQAAVRSAYVVSYYDARLTQPQDTLRWLSASATSRKLLVVDQWYFAPSFQGDSAKGCIGSYRIVVPAAGQRYDLRNCVVPVRRSPFKNGCDQAASVRFRLNGQLVTSNGPAPALADAMVLH